MTAESTGKDRVRRRIFSRGTLRWTVWMILPGVWIGARAGDSPSDCTLIYLHGRIVQEQQDPHPKHPLYGTYELDAILDAFRQHGFSVLGGIRPKSATVSESADAVVGQVGRLLESGARPERITIVGASMGAGIALLASSRLQNPSLRFSILGACLSESVRQLLAEEGKGPKGHILSIRESSDETTKGCAAWKEGLLPASGLEMREIVIDTGLSHGFLYRPLPAWMNPVIEWAKGAARKGAGN